MPAPMGNGEAFGPIESKCALLTRCSYSVTCGAKLEPLPQRRKRDRVLRSGAHAAQRFAQFDYPIRFDIERIEHELFGRSPVRTQSVAGVQGRDLFGEQAEGDELSVRRLGQG